MRSEEEFSIGGSGIDTQYERDYINYKPTMEHSKEQTQEGDGYQLIQPTHAVDLFAQLASSTIVDTWEEVIGVVKKSKLIEKKLADKLKNISAPATGNARVQKAAEKMGYPHASSEIPFALYKGTFKFPDAPESAVIQEAFENYMSDVQGNLNAELYTDVAEIQNDWEDVLGFVRKGLFAQMVPMEQVPHSLSMEDPVVAEVRKKEQAQLNEYLELTKLRQLNQDIMDRLARSQYGSDRYYEAETEYEKARREVVTLEKKLFTKAEVVDLVRRKVSDTEDSLELIDNSVDFDPYQDHKYEVLYGLLQQFDSKQAMVSSMQKMQALLQLSVDGKRQRIDAVKSNLRGLAGGKTKQRINQTLVNGVHLRNGVFSEVYDVLKHLDGVPNIRNFHLMIDHLSEGVAESDVLYKRQLSDFYKIHAMDAELRSEKLRALIDKDMTRGTYQMMRAVSTHAAEADTAWPTADKLSGWLNDFMEQGKIK